MQKEALWNDSQKGGIFKHSCELEQHPIGKDGATGPDDPNTSESVLFDWWNIFGNTKIFLME